MEQLQGAVYLVGGSVRDLILGREFVDVDLAVDGETRSNSPRSSAPHSP